MCTLHHHTVNNGLPTGSVILLPMEESSTTADDASPAANGDDVPTNEGDTAQ